MNPLWLYCVCVLSGSSYLILADEIGKYGSSKTAQTAHLSNPWLLPFWAVVYALALPTAVIVRCIYGKRGYIRA